jgi:hypothetical protein
MLGLLRIRASPPVAGSDPGDNADVRIQHGAHCPVSVLSLIALDAFLLLMKFATLRHKRRRTQMFSHDCEPHSPWRIASMR